MTEPRTLTDEEGDTWLIRRAAARWFLWLFAVRVRLIAKAMVFRAYDRGFIDSRGMHEMLAMIDRAFPYNYE